MRYRAALTAIAFTLCFTGGVAHADPDHPIRDPATGVMIATRLNNPFQHEAPPPPPPPPGPPGWTTESSNGRCTGLIGLLTYFSPGWDVNRMAGIAYRESRCQPGASNSCCSGVLQMHRMHVPNSMCGVYSRNDYYNPVANICAAAALWRASGYGAWSTA